MLLIRESAECAHDSIMLQFAKKQTSSPLGWSMSVDTQTQPRPRPRTAYLPRRAANPWLARLTLIFVSIIILTNLIAALVLAGYQIYYDRHIYPGVHVW